MRLQSVRIENFRALANVEIPLSDFGCLIGENNAGKSSILHALMVVLTGAGPKRIEQSDFFDPARPIRIELAIDGITETDLMRISDDGHRASLAADVVEGALTIVRIVSTDGAKQSLRVQKLGPANDNLTDVVLLPLMKSKSNPELRAAVVALLPELDDKLPDKPTQKAIKDARDELIAALPADEMIMRDEPLGTGIDAAIRRFLPEPIYIEAVKDVSGELKTTDTATFGKLLRILLDEIADQFGDIEEKFGEIQRKLSRIVTPAGEVKDDRLEQVRRIEETIQTFVRESFPDIQLKMTVPVPQLRTIFSSAELSADDGHEGTITSKGDGLKRAVAFAILRAYTVLRSDGLHPNREPASKPTYILLFEEPELYLHPRAQRQLFRALETFALDHPVLVTTHSPVFFSADATKTFVKLRKEVQSVGQAPSTTPYPVDLRGAVSDRDIFQIICHENNDIAFFARTVVLVEGDSDAIVFAHLARLLNPEWDHMEQNVAYARIGGKHNVSRYRDFFARFDIRVLVLCDLDAILDGFKHLTGAPATLEIRERLMKAVSEAISEDEIKEITAGQASKIARRGDARSAWIQAREAYRAIDEDPDAANFFRAAMDEFFDSPSKDARLEALAGTSPGVVSARTEMLAALREEGVNVLQRGDLEDYYGTFNGTGSSDKVRHAISLCAATPTLQDYESLLGADAEEITKELKAVMTRIYDQPVEATA
ncbi:ATP-dependent endonuclease [Salinibacterium sp. ZJ454]|uniref:AAA family ATPase n=1 Tax=Salinibacterium sp. ZJ454 TaxID=2708339 RepID=UPI00141DACA6|nr:ATP-dependent endonuclease [Salinibacterium sp. ZJ454]